MIHHYKRYIKFKIKIQQKYLKKYLKINELILKY